MVYFCIFHQALIFPKCLFKIWISSERNLVNWLSRGNDETLEEIFHGAFEKSLSCDKAFQVYSKVNLF